jgi:hypothetical protein
VEAVLPDGAVAVAVFSGPDAEQWARAYLAWKKEEGAMEVLNALGFLLEDRVRTGDNRAAEEAGEHLVRVRALAKSLERLPPLAPAEPGAPGIVGMLGGGGQPADLAYEEHLTKLRQREMEMAIREMERQKAQADDGAGSKADG